jgi:cytoskeletal protein CcmA (bactofilin family)
MTFANLRSRVEKLPRERVETGERPPEERQEETAPTAWVTASSELTGKLRSEGSVRIDGRLEGEVSCGQTVFISNAARVHANVEAESAVIAGEVRGDIVARRKITLDRTARVTGNLCTPGIVIEEGARLKGRIVIGGEEEPAVKQAAARPEAPKPEEPGATPRPARRSPTKEAAGPQPEV